MKRALAGALLLALTGCGSKDAAADPSDASPSSSGIDPSESATATVEPAKGDLMDTATASIRAPAGWTVTTPIKDQTVVGASGNGLSSLGLDIVDVNGADYSLQQLARLEIQTIGYADGQVMPETGIAGEPAFHVHGKAGAGTTYDAYGLEHDGHTVTVVFKLHSTLQGNHQQLIDSVLATLELR